MIQIPDTHAKFYANLIAEILPHIDGPSMFMVREQLRGLQKVLTKENRDDEKPARQSPRGEDPQ